jgi:hypothetical protein
MNKRGIYIGKNNEEVCFGQTGEYHSFNEFSDTLLFTPDGAKKVVELHYLEVIPIEDLYKYPDRHKYLNANGHYNN